MGYYVTLTDADFRIPKELLDPAFEALTALNSSGEKHGGSSDGRVWFAWMPEDYPAEALQAVASGHAAHPTEAVFNMLGFSTEYDESGQLCLTYYDSKMGDEDQFLRAVAPFVAPDSYLTWQGEDGAYWRHEFDGVGGMAEREGRVVFD